MLLLAQRTERLTVQLTARLAAQLAPQLTAGLAIQLTAVLSAVLTVQLLPARRFRTSGDIRQTWASVHRNLQTALPYLDKDKPISQPHCWAYPDSPCQAATQCLSCCPRAAGSICCAGTSAAGRKSANGRAKSSPLRRVVCDQRAALPGLRPPQPLARGRDDAHNRQRGSDRRESTVRGKCSARSLQRVSTGTSRESLLVPVQRAHNCS